MQCGAFDAVARAAGHHARARVRGDRSRARALTQRQPRSRARADQPVRLVRRRGNGGNARPRPRGDDTRRRSSGTAWRCSCARSAALGCYVSGHPLFRYQSKLPRIGALGTLELADQKPWSAASVAGMVENYQEKLFKGGSGGRAAFFEIEDHAAASRRRCAATGSTPTRRCSPAASRCSCSGKVSFPMTRRPSDEEREPTLLVDGVELLSDAALARHPRHHHSPGRRAHPPRRPRKARRSCCCVARLLSGGARLGDERRRASRPGLARHARSPPTARCSAGSSAPSAAPSPSSARRTTRRASTELGAAVR